MLSDIFLLAFLVFGGFIILKTYKIEVNRAKQRDIEDKIFKEMLLNRLYDISVSLDYCSGRRPLRKEDVIK